MTAAPDQTLPAPAGTGGATRRAWPRRLAAVAVLLLVGTVVSLVLLSEAKPPALTVADPGDGQRLDALPPAVTLTFNGRLDPAGSHLTVADAAGRPVNTATARVAGQTISQPVDRLPPGRYQVAYHVTFGNGTVLTDLYSFTVRGQQPGTGPGDRVVATPVVDWTTAPSEASGGHVHGLLQPRGLAMISAYFALILVGLFVLHRRRQKRR
ncbi:copper resistance protein CopC [Solwaraspora sp. WMMD1047]|uniref:copper resistance CopC family protein n=1 Tax=Solwaraspora sp. WMMD1047 TaxID=3016102 RepID=UPI0024162BBD|nr:copper resistance CopC family protein [Solwaraspora sp. WMMD1047]MDG4829903.1 copper resistance protein CopC [Solwaraspora sp. WMMD1047]